jgi:death on curing protein
MTARGTWVLDSIVRAIHDAQLAEHGGIAGIRDEGLLASALARPHNLEAYGEGVDAASLAASYAFGIARNHPFLDGNKRTAFVVMELFLNLNGWELNANDADCISTMQALASGDLSEKALATWLRKNIESL